MACAADKDKQAVIERATDLGGELAMQFGLNAASSSSARSAMGRAARAVAIPLHRSAVLHLERHLRDVVMAIGVVFVRHRDGQNLRGTGILPTFTLWKCTNALTRYMAIRHDCCPCGVGVNLYA